MFIYLVLEDQNTKSQPPTVPGSLRKVCGQVVVQTSFRVQIKLRNNKFVWHNIFEQAGAELCQAQAQVKLEVVVEVEVEFGAEVEACHDQPGR